MKEKQIIILLIIVTVRAATSTSGSHFPHVVQCCCCIAVVVAVHPMSYVCHVMHYTHSYILLTSAGNTNRYHTSDCHTLPYVMSCTIPIYTSYLLVHVIQIDIVLEIAIHCHMSCHTLLSYVMSQTIPIHTSSLLVQVIQICVKLNIVNLEIEIRPTTSYVKKKFSNLPFTYICRY